jgi:hypothetical protein
LSGINYPPWCNGQRSKRVVLRYNRLLSAWDSHQMTCDR